MKIVIYSLENCGFSMKAEQISKNHFNKKNIEIIKVKSKDKDKYKKKHQQKTFPHIFIMCETTDPKYHRVKIGGCDDLIDLIESNYDFNSFCKNKKLPGEISRNSLDKSEKKNLINHLTSLK